ncbi:hypothetical protein POPTR_001G241254v4 [Populus trichocarpa]|uniref:Uncharacterized protein n=1 Tax=Populus trichocarpa TaxID=3694 RepID=A0ACC0TKZ6_POPTR|nr:hypothetical protein POPTR_001G241254v4 [Populus trichocarpa]
MSLSLSLPLSLHLCSSSWVDFEVLQKKPGESSLFNIEHFNLSDIEQ